MLIHYIVEPVRELSSVAEKISGGELDIEIAYQSEDEIGELAEDFRKTANTLPVSYTHLDVYKRQEGRSSGEAGIDRI